MAPHLNEEVVSHNGLGCYPPLNTVLSEAIVDVLLFSNQKSTYTVYHGTIPQNVIFLTGLPTQYIQRNVDTP